MFEAENFVALGFVIFLGLLVYLGAHRRVIDGIDRRQARIKSELDEAVRLRQEAQAVLAEFERKAREAEGEAASIIAGAKAEAERLSAEAKTRMEGFCCPPHQDGRGENCAGGSPGTGGCTRRRGRHRCRRGGAYSRRRRQGQSRRGFARARH